MFRQSAASPHGERRRAAECASTARGCRGRMGVRGGEVRVDDRLVQRYVHQGDRVCKLRELRLECAAGLCWRRPHEVSHHHLSRSIFDMAAVAASGRSGTARVLRFPVAERASRVVQVSGAPVIAQEQAPADEPARPAHAACAPPRAGRATAPSLAPRHPTCSDSPESKARCQAPAASRAPHRLRRLAAAFPRPWRRWGWPP